MRNLLPLQQEIYAALVGASGALYPVYDAVPQKALKPHIVIGEVTAEPGEEIAETSEVAFVSFHCWSATHGKEECHQMLAYIASVLDNVVPLEFGGEWWLGFEEFREILEDPKSRADARLYHAVARYQFRT